MNEIKEFVGKTIAEVMLNGSAVYFRFTDGSHIGLCSRCSHRLNIHFEPAAEKLEVGTYATCGCCGSENTLIKTGRGWRCTVCRSRETVPAPSEQEIQERKTELRLRPRRVFNGRDAR